MPGAQSQVARIAIVTGANRGIGWEIARLLATGVLDYEPMPVIPVCRRAADAEETAKRLNSKFSIEMDAMQFPISVDAAAKAIAKIIASLRADDDEDCDSSPCYSRAVEVYLVNNAGVYFDEWSEHAWAESRTVNYQLPLRLIQQLQAEMRTPQQEISAAATTTGVRDRPSSFMHLHSIVNVSSGYGQLRELTPDYQSQLRKILQQARETSTQLHDDSLAALDAIDFAPTSAMRWSYVAPYKVTKAMLNVGTVVLAHRYSAAAGGGASTRINVVCPGWCRTRMGGMAASRSAEEGAMSVLKTLLEVNATGEMNGRKKTTCRKATGGFFRDGKEIDL